LATETRQPRNPAEELIISVAVNGGELRLSDTPYVPITPEAIAQSTREAAEAGAAIAHIHVRADDGSPSVDLERFRQVMELVRAECDIVLNFSTLASDPDFLQLAPEIASLPVGSVNLGENLLSAPPCHVRSIARQLKETGTRPELELFHEGMISTARRLVGEGFVDPPVLAQFCLGFEGGAPADPGALLRMKEAIPPDWIWSAVGVGDQGVSVAALAIMLGGHVRVGIEDHPYYSPGVLAVSNAQLVERVVRIAREFGRSPATPAEARAILQLNSGAETPGISPRLTPVARPDESATTG
jgi:3-keto-5-aminohexanoate cleavage enzyme